MKAYVDENICICCGLCEGICSEVFTIGDGFAVAGEVITDNEDYVREACDSCPVEAITIEE